MSYYRKLVAKMIRNAEKCTDPDMKKTWKTWGSDRVFVDNPYVRVAYQGSQVKVKVTNPYYSYSYSDPYVKVEVGEPKPPEVK
jgi:hypothetical protein